MPTTTPSLTSHPPTKESPPCNDHLSKFLTIVFFIPLLICFITLPRHAQCAAHPDWQRVCRVRGETTPEEGGSCGEKGRPASSYLLSSYMLSSYLSSLYNVQLYMQSSSSPSYLSPLYLFSSFMSLSPFLLLCHPCCHRTCHHYHYSRCPNHSYHFQFILSRGEKQLPASSSLSLPASLIVLINVDCCSTADHYLSGKGAV